MKRRAGEGLPVTLLILALTALLSGCRASAPVPAAAQGIVPSAASAPTPAQGIPVTGFALEVASCDPSGTFLNFRLSDLLARDTADKLRVEFNGRSARCYSPLGDGSILSCTIPSFTAFPVLVVVRLENAVITQFTYDGAVCPVAIRGQGAQNAFPPLILASTSTVAGLPSAFSTPRPAATTSKPHPTPNALPTWTEQFTPAAQPTTSTPPPAPTAEPTLAPPPTSTTEPTLAPTSMPQPTPTEKSPPTPKPTRTPKPTHTTEPPPTEPPPTEPPPTPSG